MPFNLIEYLITHKKFKQKDIAEKLQVSPAQVSRWKKGEAIPEEREQELKELAGLFGENPQWATLVKTQENSDAWLIYFQEMNESIEYSSDNISDCPEFYVPKIMVSLSELGITIPDVPNNDGDDENEDPLNRILYAIVDNYGILEHWCSRYMLLVYNDVVYSAGMQVESCFRDLAIAHLSEANFAKLGVSELTFQNFQNKIRKETFNCIESYCQTMQKERLPFQADYFDLINEEPDSLSHQLEYSYYYANSVRDLLPYGEQKILENLQHTQQLLLELHVKLDTLLPVSALEDLKKHLELTDPTTNRYLKSKTEKLQNLKLDS